jgi:hypothetical protein
MPISFWTSHISSTFGIIFEGDLRNSWSSHSQEAFPPTSPADTNVCNCERDVLFPSITWIFIAKAVQFSTACNWSYTNHFCGSSGEIIVLVRTYVSLTIRWTQQSVGNIWYICVIRANQMHFFLF